METCWPVHLKHGTQPTRFECGRPIRSTYHRPRFAGTFRACQCTLPLGRSEREYWLNGLSWWMQGVKHNVAIVHHRHNIHSATGNPIPPMPSNHILHLCSHLLLTSRRLANFNTYYSNSGVRTFNVSIYMLLYSSWCQSTGCSITMHLTFQTHKWPILFYW